jgi:hypothetical protein
MDKAQALHAFWSSFSWEAIDEQSAYDTQTMEALGSPDRYITYEVATGSLGEPISLSASLWHHSTSWAVISQKADEIAAYIGFGGRILPVDGGYLWIKLGSTFSQRMPDEGERDFRRILLNIAVDFLTAI